MTSPPDSPASSRNLCPTGVEGLDDILRGGLPRNRIFLLLGEPGSGKTTLALQFLLAGEQAGERGLYITLSETSDELKEVATSHHWDISKLHVFELSALQEELKEPGETTFFSPSEMELTRTTKVLLEQVEKIKPTRVVFDSLSEVRLMAETPLRYRRQILHLKQFFAGRNCTVLMLDDGAGGDNADEQVESLAHGVMVLNKNAPDYGILRRQIAVAKMRGVKFREGNHDIIMETGGLVVFPRLVASEHHTPFRRESVTSGIDGLDRLLGGGIDRGTSTVLMGPAGAGKSTISAAFAVTAAARGEKVLFYSFDETRATLMARADELGLNLSEHVAAGRIIIQQIDPAEISPGELAFRVRQAVVHDQVRMVVVDSLNGYLHAMPDQRHLLLQLHEMLSFLNQQGVASLLILTQQGMIGTMQTPIDLIYLADTVVMLRFFEASGMVKQAISVINKRSGSHERTIRELTMADNTVGVGEPLTDFHGVLTGVPTLVRAIRAASDSPTPEL